MASKIYIKIRHETGWLTEGDRYRGSAKCFFILARTAVYPAAVEWGMPGAGSRDTRSEQYGPPREDQLSTLDTDAPTAAGDEMRPNRRRADRLVLNWS